MELRLQERFFRCCVDLSDHGALDSLASVCNGQGNAFGTASANPDRITHLHFEMKSSGTIIVDPSPYFCRQLRHGTLGSPGLLESFP